MMPTSDTVVSQTQPQNGVVPQTDAFMHTTQDRQCKSAPAAGTTLDGTESISSLSSSISCESSGNEKKEKGKHPKKDGLSWEKFLNFFFGHAHEFTHWTTSFSQSSRLKFISLFLLESIFRSIGDVTFCSNPWTGLVILIAMLISTPTAACLAFVTLASGMATALLFLRVPMDEVRSGGVLFNNFLAGIIIGCFVREDVIMVSPEIIPICMGFGILTTLLWSGLNGTLATHLDFPMLIAPFHIVLLLYLFSGLADKFKLEETTSHYKDMTTNDTIPPYETVPLNWVKVMEGIVLSPGHVFATPHVETSLMIYASIMLYSPTMMIQSFTGASIGSMVGIYLAAPGEYKEIYDGSWSFNAQFTAAALGGVLFIFNFHSWLLSIVGSILSTVFFSAMVKYHLPPLGIPFMLTVWLLLLNRPYEPEPAAVDSSTSGETLSSGDSTVKIIPASPPPPPPRPRQGPLYRLRLADITTPESSRKLLPRDNYPNPNSDKYSQAQKPPTPMQNAILPL